MVINKILNLLTTKLLMTKQVKKSITHNNLFTFA